MVVEFLTFQVEDDLRAEWMEADERTWSRYLAQRPGFLSKQLWVERDHPGEVHAVIVWSDWESWQKVPHEEIATLDEEMGGLFRRCTVRIYDVVRDH
jgi:uncharacterized protein (TIGR03792 family)